RRCRGAYPDTRRGAADRLGGRVRIRRSALFGHDGDALVFVAQGRRHAGHDRRASCAAGDFGEGSSGGVEFVARESGGGGGVNPPLNPFALSLSKGCSFFCDVPKKNGASTSSARTDVGVSFRPP